VAEQRKEAKRRQEGQVLEMEQTEVLPPRMNFKVAQKKMTRSKKRLVGSITGLDLLLTNFLTADRF
jgi:hypothetical protein